MKFLLFLFLIIVIILLVKFIINYTKTKEKQKNSNKNISIENPFSYQDKRHEDFLKSINIVNEKNNIVLGKIYLNGKQEYLIEEKKDNGYIYYLGNDIIGGYNPKVKSDELIIFRENTIENQLSDQIKDEIVQLIHKSKKRKELENERKRINQRTINQNLYDQEMGYQKSIGQEKKHQKAKQYEELHRFKENVQNRNIEIEKQLKTNQQKIQNTVRDIDIKQEVDMNTMVTDMDTIGKRLEDAGKINGKEKKGKLAFVESDDLDNLRDENGKRLQGHSSRYEAVSIDKKGNVRALHLENDTQEGTNPIEHNYQVKQNKNKDIKKGDVLTRLQIQGEETIGIEKGQYGEVEVYHSHDKTVGGNDIEGNKSLDKQLETKDSKNPVEGIDESMQKLSQKYQDGYRSVEDSYQEAKQHENTREEPCEELKTEELDGNLNTVSHSHTEDIVAKLMKNREISDKFTEREVRERVKKAWDKKEEDMSTNEFQKNMEEDMEADAENMRGERGR